MSNIDRLMQARAYVTSRFYPPLPAVYGDLAVQALDAIAEHGEKAVIALPVDLNPLPRDARVLERPFGEVEIFVDAVDLIRVLRLTHLLDDDEGGE